MKRRRTRLRKPFCPAGVRSSTCSRTMAGGSGLGPCVMVCATLLLPSFASVWTGEALLRRANCSRKMGLELRRRGTVVALCALVAATTLASAERAPAQAPARSGKKADGKAKPEAPKIDPAKIKAALESGDERRDRKSV